LRGGIADRGSLPEVVGRSAAGDDESVLGGVLLDVAGLPLVVSPVREETVRDLPAARDRVPE
jgi:hypothetical protein